MSANANPPPSETSGHGVSPTWLVRLCQPARMLWLTPLLGFVLTLPSVFSGYVQDDHVFRQNSLEQTIYPRRAAWDYFHWIASESEIAHYRERGIQQVTWWTPDTARSRFFRPLSSLLAAQLLRRFSSNAAACGIACLLFAVDDAHAYSAGWIASGNTLLTALFGLFALLMHDRWRRDRSIAGLALSLTGFALSLLSSEGGLALLGYLVAYALFLDQGRWHKRLTTLIPAALIAAGYLAFYFWQHLGIRGSFDWLSPTEDLWLTARVVVSGTLTGAIAQVTSIPMLALLLQGAGMWGPIVAAALLAALIALFWRFLGSSKTVAFFGAGMLLSLVPFSVGMMGDRYLLWASLGGAGLRYEKQGQWPEHFYHLFDGIDAMTVKRTGERTLLVTPDNGFFASSPMSRGARPRELVFQRGQQFNLQLMTATIEELAEDRPRSVSFAFKKDLGEFAWLTMTMSGPRPFQLPAPGEEVLVDPWSP